MAVAAYIINFPNWLDGYEHETQSKGYLVGVRVESDNRVYDLVIYDPIRLRQDIEDEVQSAGYFAAPNLLVVSVVTRAEIEAAIRDISGSGFSGFHANTSI
ncbi:hypothetical protein GCM10009733_010420 [Nonomuraea maheshkhaliensis]|uniref:Uncharacterized protein n=1 Tax=Nonomuraea maheshkhaliensis TaxID=419590 RepID=A0ABP4QR24_9ACTN